MVSSSAETPEEYLRELEPSRAAELVVVRSVIEKAMPDGFVECMGFGMITWVVPLEVYPATYNKKPLMYVALAAQKNYSSVYLMPLYSGGTVVEKEFRARWAGSKRLDLGKACVRFRAASDLDLDLIGDVISSCTLDGFVDFARSVTRSR